MRIFTKGSEKIEDENDQVDKLKLKVTGCFDFRQKECKSIMASGGLTRLSKKMMRSRSDPDISPSKKTATNANKVTSKSAPGKLTGGGAAPRRRFVRVVRGDSRKEDEYYNPHVKRKSSDSTPPVRKIDFEALNRRYFSDSDSDTSASDSLSFMRARSEERSPSPVIQAGQAPMRKDLSLDVETPKRTHFKEEVDVIGIDKKGKQVYTAMERIQFDNFEVCDIRSEQDMCPVSAFDVLESISETPELSKSPPRLLEGMETAKVELEKKGAKESAVVKMQVVSGGSMDSESDKENAPDKSSEVSGAESDSLSDAERETQSESDALPRTSSFDHKYKALRMFGFLFRSGSETRFGSPKSSPKSSPSQSRRQHKYLRVLRDTDHGDEYYNPHVVRRSPPSTLSRSMGNLDDHPRPILRKNVSMDLHELQDKHAHFQENVQIVEFHKKDKCVDFAPASHVQMDQLKSDSEETDSVDEITDDVFSMHCENSDPGVSSDGSIEDVSVVGADARP